jgi:two-component system cell cycle sensor histidine kinase/response regulator CckA
VTRLAVVEIVVIATGVLTALVVKAFLRVHAEADELRRLEIRLQHMQRLHVVGQLAGVAAHDFRNVLGIFQNAASLLSSMEDPAARALGTDLLQTARSGQAITKGLLSLARREEPRRSIIDVAQTVEGLRPLVTRLIGPRCILTLDATGPATALADPGEIEQMVLNLTANARDSMAGAGRVKVLVRSLSRPEAERLGSRLNQSHQVVLEVQDHGTGIAPELHARIFEPFVTTKARGEGTGLGLATVRSIATASGGEVALESVPGAGATFRVFLPRTDGVGSAA